MVLAVFWVMGEELPPLKPEEPAILTYARAGVAGVSRRLPLAVKSLRETGYPGKVFIVDDCSTCPEQLRTLETMTSEIAITAKCRR